MASFEGYVYSGSGSSFVIEADGSTTDPSSANFGSGSGLNRTDAGYDSDEILSLLPAFSYSLPVQVLVTGINLSIVFVILSHLLFTASYHYPLSKHNFLLQLCGAIFLIINLATELAIIFTHAHRQSRRYPFGFNFVAVQVPPNEDSWTFAQQFFYLLLRAITVLLVHLTHIQFLTLLFPSRLERRMILWMLGPLALIGAGMQFGDFTSADAQKTSDLLDTLQRISESTLTMLYTCALLIWGLGVNRGRAWRTDGGTAAFGSAACFLALANTSMAFLELRFDYLHWLPDLTWVVTASQSWLGYWWWVGAGMGIGEVEDRAARAMRKRKRAIRRQRREQHKAAVAAAAAAAAAAREKESSSVAGGSAAGTAGGESSALGSLRKRLGFGSATGGLAGSSGGSAQNGAGGAESVAGSATSGGGSRLLQRRTGGGRSRTGGNDSAAENVELQEVIVDSSQRSGAVEREDSSTPRTKEQRPGAATRRSSTNAVPQTPGSGVPLQQSTSMPYDAALSVSGMTTGSGSSNPSSSPANFLTRGLRTLAEIQPSFVKARIDRLRREHAIAARRNARAQTAVVERIMVRNPQAGLYRAESRRAPVTSSSNNIGGPTIPVVASGTTSGPGRGSAIAVVTSANNGRVSSSSSKTVKPRHSQSQRNQSSNSTEQQKASTTTKVVEEEEDEDGEGVHRRASDSTARQGKLPDRGDNAGSGLSSSRRRGGDSGGPDGGDVAEATQGDDGIWSDINEEDEVPSRVTAGMSPASDPYPSAGPSSPGGPGSSDRARAWVSGAVKRMRLKESDTYS